MPLLSLGFTQTKVILTLLKELIPTIVFSILIGLMLSVVYVKLVVLALNTIWLGAVGDSVIHLFIDLNKLFLGGIITFVISFLTIYFTLKINGLKSINELQRKTLKLKKSYKRTRNSFIFLLAVLILLVTTLIIISNKVSDNLSLLFVLSGIVLLLLSNIICLLALDLLAYPGGLKKFNLMKSSFRGMRKRVSIIFSISISVFIVFSVGMNRRSFDLAMENKNSGSGGFEIYSEFTYSVANPNELFVDEIDKGFEILSVRRMTQNDASCLNLNSVTNPGVLGIDFNVLSGRFSFIKTIKETTKPWALLREDFGQNTIPCIIDDTVLTWGIKKKIGDVLVFKDSNGNKINLKIIGSIKSSIFQGNVIIDEQSFKKHFRNLGGYSLFLFNSVKDDVDLSKLQIKYKEFGAIFQKSKSRLNTFYKIESTYLNIFLILASLGILLGLSGSAILLFKDLLYRRNEFALMLSIGFKYD